MLCLSQCTYDVRRACVQKLPDCNRTLKIGAFGAVPSTELPKSAIYWGLLGGYTCASRCSLTWTLSPEFATTRAAAHLLESGIAKTEQYEHLVEVVDSTAMDPLFSLTCITRPT